MTENLKDYKPKPDQDGKIEANSEGEKVKVVDGKATPTEETVARAVELQKEGDEVAEEKRRDAAGADKEAKLKKAAEARAAKAAAKESETAGSEAEAPAPAPKEPSRNQPFLDRITAIVGELAGPEAIVSSEINEKNNELPTITVQGQQWLKTAETLKYNPEVSLNYLRNLSGVDQETHLEVVYHLMNVTTKTELCVKVKTEREKPSIPSVTPIWATANWNEREVYDLLGIDFPGHPDLRRIMMSDDWIGHPLRKDYEAHDPEV